MSACQVEVDGRWYTGCHVEEGNVEAVRKHWSETMQIKSVKSIDIMMPSDPYWKAEYFKNGQWVSYLGESQGELRAMLYLYGRLAATREIHPADWRIKRWHPTIISTLDPLVPAILGPR